jgi:chromosome segregation ATPase
MNDDNATTKPSIETVLERVNELGGQINNQLTELRTGQVQLHNEVAELRIGQAELRADQVEMRNDVSELISVQRKMRVKFDVLNDTLLSIQADLRDDRRDFDGRLEKLESRQP